MANIELGNVETYIRQLILEEFGFGSEGERSAQNVGLIVEAPERKQSDLQDSRTRREASNDE